MEIKQELGFSAEGALATLGKLDKSLQTFEFRLKSSAEAARGFNTAGKQVERMGKAFGSNVPQMTEQVEKLTVSWGLLARIVTTQFIVAEFRRLRATLAESARSAAEFQTRIAEIQTIADGSLGTFDQVGQKVRGISDAFNLPLGDAAKGIYEVLSSQIADGAEAVDFLGSAAAFAKGSVTSLENATTLLAGTLNAFEKDASQADDVASKLFRTIDLGNVTAEQLVTSFNRTSGRAQQLGISFEEQAAAFAVLTNRGIKHNEVATQLSGIITGLVKATPEMTEALKTLGFSTSASAIQTLGLSGLLKELQGTTNGTAEELAQLFPNVRGLAGALSLGTQANQQFNDALKEIQGTSAELNKQKAFDILATDAQRAQLELQKFRNLLTVDFGQAILRGAATTAELTGGVDNLAAIMKAFGPVLATGTALLGAYAVAAAKGATANAAFVKSFAGASQGLLLAAGAVAGGSFLGDQLIQEIQRPQQELDRLAQAAIKKLMAVNADRLRIEQEASEEREKIALESVRDLNRAYLDDVANAETAGKLLLSASERITDRIIKDRQRLADNLIRHSNNAVRFVDESAARVLGLQDSQEQRRFELESRDFSDTRRLMALSQRAADFASQAVKELQRAGAIGDQQGIARAVELFNRADATAESARSIAERTDNRSAELRIMAQIDKMTKDQIRGETLLQRAQAGRQQALNKLSEKQTSILRTVREQSEVLRKAAEEGDRDAAAAARRKIQESGFSAGDLELFDAAGVGQAARAFNLKLAQESLELKFSVEEEITRIQDQLKRSFESFKIALPFDTGIIEQQLDRVFQTPDEVVAGIGDITDATSKLADSFAKLQAQDANIKRLQIDINGIAEASNNADRSALRLLGAGLFSSDTRTLVSNLRVEIERLSASGQITDAQLASVFEQLTRLRNDAVAGGVAKNVGFATDVTEFSRAIGLLKELQTLQQQRSANPAAAPGAADRLEALRRLNLSFSQAVQPANNIASAFERGANAAERMANATASLRPGGFANGGVAHLAFGGRGTDTVPAMLSPGEFVVNSRSAQRFFPQLQAMNAGRVPAFSDGGSVDNSIGDVTINVNGGKTNGETAKVVASEIYRLQRRASLRRFR